MNFRSLGRAWNEFFFAPISPTGIGVFRFVYGWLVVADLILLRGDWFTWYGTHAFMRMDTMRQVAPGPRINLFAWMPQSDLWIDRLFWVFLIFAVLLAVGLFSRVSSIVVCVAMISIHQRNFFILNSGDTLLRLYGIFLVFAPCGAAFSLDRLLRIWRGRESAEARPRAPWAQRLIQFQTAVAYFATFYWKSEGSMWLDGTAVYYSSRLVDFQRFPMPALHTGPILKLITWSTLAFEFALGTLVWIKELRYWILLAGLALHAGIEYSMNVPLFQWVIVSSYLTFVYPEDWVRLRNWAREKAARHIGATDVVFDSRCAQVAHAANLLAALDVLGRLRILDLYSAETRKAWPRLAVQDGRTRLLVARGGELIPARQGLGELSRRIPLLWPVAPLTAFSGQRKQSLKAARAAK